MKRFISMLAVCVLVGLPAARAAGNVEDPLQLLREGVEEVMAVVYDETGDKSQPLSARVRPVLAKYFEFNTVTKRAVGPGWRKLSEYERARVTELFSTLVLRTYADNFAPGARPKVRYGTAVDLGHGRRELPTTVVYNGKEFAVSYRVEQTPAGWRIYDVKAEGVSMIANYRAQFQPILQRGGGKALIDALEKNLESVAKS